MNHHSFYYNHEIWINSIINVEKDKRWNGEMTVFVYDTGVGNEKSSIKNTKWVKTVKKNQKGVKTNKAKQP